MKIVRTNDSSSSEGRFVTNFESSPLHFVMDLLVLLKYVFVNRQALAMKLTRTGQVVLSQLLQL